MPEPEPDTTRPDRPEITEPLRETTDVTNPDPIPDVIDSVFIECDGTDIGAQVNAALSDNQRILIGVGDCTSSVQWDHPSGTDLQGMGMGATRVTFTGDGTECATKGPDSDTSSGFISNLTLIMDDPGRDIICISGLSNTSVIDRVETRGGRHHIVLTPATSDDSSAWVGLISNWISVDAGGSGLHATGGNMRLTIASPTVLRSAGPSFHFIDMKRLATNVGVVNADLRPTGGLAILAEGSGGCCRDGSPLVLLGSRATLGVDQTFIAADYEIEVALIDVEVGANCDLFLDRPGSGDAIPCTAGPQMVTPDGNGGHDVVALDTGGQATWRTWAERIVASTKELAPFWTLDDIEEIPCAEDIGPAVASALSAGKSVLIGKGQCTSSVDWEIGPGQTILGMSTSVPEDGGEQGTYVIFDDAEATECAVGGSGADVEIRRIKLRSIAERDVICLEGFTGTISQVYTRSGKGHIVFTPDENGVTVDGGVVTQLLSFLHTTGCIIEVRGNDSPTNLTLVGLDIGRGGPGAHICLDGMRDSESAVTVFGNIFALSNMGSGGSAENLMQITGSGSTPVLYLNGQPDGITEGSVLIVADSDIPVTVVGSHTRSNPRENIVCDLLIDKPGSAVSCTSFLTSVLALED